MTVFIRWCASGLGAVAAENRCCGFRRLRRHSHTMRQEAGESQRRGCQPPGPLQGRSGPVQIRNPTTEGRKKPEGRDPNPKPFQLGSSPSAHAVPGFRFSDFGVRISGPQPLRFSEEAGLASSPARSPRTSERACARGLSYGAIRHRAGGAAMNIPGGRRAQGERRTGLSLATIMAQKSTSLSPARSAPQ